MLQVNNGKNQEGKKEVRYFDSLDELIEYNTKTGEIRLKNGLTLKDIKFVPKGQKENRYFEDEEPLDLIFDEEDLEDETLEQEEEDQERLFALDMLKDGEEENTRPITVEDGFLLGDKGNIYNALDEDLVFTRPEQWLHIDGYLDYMVSTFGRVHSIKRNKILKPRLRPDGYYDIKLWKNGKDSRELIHRLVAKAFIDNPNNLPCINHRDEDKSNNCVWNLEWCNYSYNNNYSIYKQQRPVQQLDLKTGKVIATYKSLNDAARILGINVSGISQVCNGKCKTYKGYGFRYTKQYDNFSQKMRPVEQFDLKTVKVIAKYKNLRDAARHLPLGNTKVESAAAGIKKCCDGLLKSYKGFGFRYF